MNDLTDCISIKSIAWDNFMHFATSIAALYAGTPIIICLLISFYNLSNSDLEPFIWYPYFFNPFKSESNNSFSFLLIALSSSGKSMKVVSTIVF